MVKRKFNKDDFSMSAFVFEKKYGRGVKYVWGGKKKRVVKV